uniref:Uncharacterized protein n=1 Tax=Ditylenchus dipsaci TaxID=166011 RepID=A0A915D5H3_9BILA
MEADLFEHIYNSLEQHKKRIKLPLRNACPISKIIWSSFDYMAGPELKFVWEADYLDSSQDHCESVSHLNAGASSTHLLDETATMDGSTDSSFQRIPMKAKILLQEINMKILTNFAVENF